MTKNKTNIKKSIKNGQQTNISKVDNSNYDFSDLKFFDQKNENEENQIVDFDKNTEGRDTIHFVKQDGVTKAIGSLNATARTVYGVGSHHSSDGVILRSIVSNLVEGLRRKTLSFALNSILLLVEHIANKMKASLSDVDATKASKKVVTFGGKKVTVETVLTILDNQIVSGRILTEKLADIFTDNESLDKAPIDAEFHALIQKLGGNK